MERLKKGKNMTLMNKVILVIGIVCLAVVVYEYAAILEECKHWQTKAWALWNQATADYTTGKSTENPGVPALWWSQNPWMISIYVWSTILKNWILALVGVGSGVYNSYFYVKRRKYKTLLKRGGNIACNVS